MAKVKSSYQDRLRDIRNLQSRVQKLESDISIMVTEDSFRAMEIRAGYEIKYSMQKQLDFIDESRLKRLQSSPIMVCDGIMAAIERNSKPASFWTTIINKIKGHGKVL